MTLNFGLKADAETQPSGDATGALYVAFADGGQPRQLLSQVMGSPAWQPVP